MCFGWWHSRRGVATEGVSAQWEEIDCNHLRMMAGQCTADTFVHRVRTHQHWMMALRR